MKLKDMTINELRKYEEVKTSKPRNDMILVKDLREWAKAKYDEQKEILLGLCITDGMPDDIKNRILHEIVEVLGKMEWIKKNFNLEEKV